MILHLLISFVFSEEVAFKLSNGIEVHICSYDGTKTMGCRGGEISKFNIIHENGKVFIESKKYGKVFDIANEKDQRLILWKKHGGANQQFEIKKVGEDTFYLMNRGKCVAYGKDGTFIYESCDTKTSKKFNIIIDEKPKEELPKPVINRQKVSKDEESVYCPVCERRYRRRHSGRHYRPMDQ